nr:MAG TPA: hypothetical protein [Caudoviricetes sp.]
MVCPHFVFNNYSRKPDALIWCSEIKFPITFGVDIN